MSSSEVNPRLQKRAVDLVDLPMTPWYVSPLRGLRSSVHGGCVLQPDVGAMMPPKSSNTFYLQYVYLLTIIALSRDPSTRHLDG